MLAGGPGWYVQDVMCHAGPDDEPFEERHGNVSLAAVIRGTFRYRCDQGTAMLVPGAVMLGNPGGCFECGHEHAVGDRCLSFHYDPKYWERLLAGMPGARRATFSVPRLPPNPSLIRMTATLETASDARPVALEQAALDFAAAVVNTLDDRVQAAKTTSRRSRLDAARITDLVRHIEATAHAADDVELSIGAMAQRVGMSPYHFLRTFRQVAGMTPYQFVLRTRLNRAATRLRTTDEEISAIALEAGFGDLSTFNRRFRRLIGVTPSAYRAGNH